MRILLLNPALPFPLTNGENVRTYSLFAQISSHHTVTAVVFAQQSTAAGLQEIGQFCENYYQIQPQKMSFVSALPGFLKKLPDCFQPFRSRTLRRNIATLLASEPFDVIHCGHVAMMAAIPDDPGVPVVVQQDTAHLPTMLAQLGFKECARTLQNRKELFRLRSALATFWSRADGIIVPVEHVRAAIVSRVAGARVFTVPHGVDARHFSHRGEEESENTLVLPGAFDRPANAEAAHYFISSIWPEIQARSNSVRLFIVGRRPPADLMRYNNYRNVFVTGEVLDIRPFIAGGTVVVFPQQVEGNSAGIKLLEALALSRAVVATPEAAAGLPIVHREHFMQGRTTAHFAECILELLEDPSLRKKLGTQARAQVERLHSWEKVAEELLTVYHRLSRPGRQEDQQPEMAVREVSESEASPKLLARVPVPPPESTAAGEQNETNGSPADAPVHPQ